MHSICSSVGIILLMLVIAGDDEDRPDTHSPFGVGIGFVTVWVLSMSSPTESNYCCCLSTQAFLFFSFPRGMCVCFMKQSVFDHSSFLAVCSKRVINQSAVHPVPHILITHYLQEDLTEAKLLLHP